MKNLLVNGIFGSMVVHGVWKKESTLSSLRKMMKQKLKLRF